MVWLFDGGFDHGSGTEKYYCGDHLAHKGAVVVTLNYRVGAAAPRPVTRLRHCPG